MSELLAELEKERLYLVNKPANGSKTKKVKSTTDSNNSKNSKKTRGGRKTRKIHNSYAMELSPITFAKIREFIGFGCG
jgi:hypothetical protein